MFFYTRLHLYLTVFVCLRQMFTSIHSLLDFLTGYTFVLGPYVLSFCTWHVLLYSVIIHVCPSLYLGLFLSPELDKNFVWCLLDTIKLSNTVSAVFEEDIKHRFIWIWIRFERNEYIYSSAIRSHYVLKYAHGSPSWVACLRAEHIYFFLYLKCKRHKNIPLIYTLIFTFFLHVFFVVLLWSRILNVVFDSYSWFQIG